MQLPLFVSILFNSGIIDYRNIVSMGYIMVQGVLKKIRSTNNSIKSLKNVFTDFLELKKIIDTY